MPMPTNSTHNIDPAIVAAVIAFVSAVVVIFWQKLLERRSINRAILAEIQRLLTVATLHEAWWADRVANKDTNYPLIPFSHTIYSKQVANIGALNNQLVVRAVKFYGYVKFINSLQESRPHYIPAKESEFDQMYLNTLKTFIADYQNAFNQDFKTIA